MIYKTMTDNLKTGIVYLSIRDTTNYVSMFAKASRQCAVLQ